MVINPVHHRHVRPSFESLAAAFNADAEDGSGERLLHWLAGGSEMSSSCITVNGQPVMLKRCVACALVVMGTSRAVFSFIMHHA